MAAQMPGERLTVCQEGDTGIPGQRQVLLRKGELAVAREVERINLQSFMAAEAKHAAGVGDLTSKLQTQTAFAQAILARGCRGFIQKPFRIVELTKKIRQILDS